MIVANDRDTQEFPCRGAVGRLLASAMTARWDTAGRHCILCSFPTPDGDRVLAGMRAKHGLLHLYLCNSLGTGMLVFPPVVLDGNCPAEIPPVGDLLHLVSTTMCRLLRRGWDAVTRFGNAREVEALLAGMAADEFCHAYDAKDGLVGVYARGDAEVMRQAVHRDRPMRYVVSRSA